MVVPPGFHEQETVIELKTCQNCKYYSGLYDGYCIQYEYNLRGKDPICESFFERGLQVCTFCGNEFPEDEKVCPSCHAQVQKIQDLPFGSPQSLDLEAFPAHGAETKIEYSDVFVSKFDLWKNALLDMSKRNNQLNFPAESKRSVEIKYPHPRDLFKDLVIDSKTFHFMSVYKPRNQLKRLTKKEKESLTEEELKERKEMENTQQENHEKAITAAIKKAHSNDLVTNLDDNRLNGALNQIRTKANHSTNEKGVNILYITFGMVKWYEEGEKTPTYSPLLFIPIKIKRISVSKGYTIELLDDDIDINPSLQEKFKSYFQIELSDFPIEYGLRDYKNYIKEIAALIEKQENWEFQERVFIGAFSFSKIALYNDLVQFKPQYFMHPIVKAIAEGSGFKEDPLHIPGPKELGDDADPSDTYSVLDTDSSQLKAVQFAEKGASLIIRGPPGTGKSQTITNIITECLSANKKVLFVAQKLAALEVVKRRLDATGVGEFCLEVHSKKANKRDVLQQISQSLGTSLRPQQIPKTKYDKLRILRQKLNQYVREINQPIGISNLSIVQRAGELGKYSHLPKINAEMRNVLDFSERKLDQIEDLFGQLEVYAPILINYTKNPWAQARITKYDLALKEQLIEKLDQFQKRLLPVWDKLEDIQSKYQFKQITNLITLDSFNKFFSNYTESALGLNVEYYQGLFTHRYEKFSRIFLPSFYRDKRTLRNAIRTWYSASVNDHLERIKNFRTDFMYDRVMPSYEGVEKQFAEIYTEAIQLESFKKDSVLDELIYPGMYMPGENLTEWQQYKKLADYWLEQIPFFDDWCAVQMIFQELKESGLERFFKEIIDNPLPEVSLPEVFYKNYLREWLEQARYQLPTLRSFNRTYHQKNIKDFILLDEEVLKINRYRLCDKLFSERPSQIWITSGETTSESGFLSKELMKKRNLKPLRDIFSRTKNFLTQIKPCLLMSPLSVAQYLPLEQYIEYFDVVVFDEASQICPEDAVGSILRGKQVIVVGDEKQLPPTRFFSSAGVANDDVIADEVEMFESILDECMGIGLPVLTLYNHYRSKKERLIAFSNSQYYSGNLNSFPDLLRNIQRPNSSEILTSVEDLPAIEFNYVEKGAYDRGGTRKNKEEAKAVAEAIIEHYRTIIKGGKNYSLGIIAFSEAQMEAIDSELEKLYKDNVEVGDFIEAQQEEELFIKNLENVQGDERDFIFFSIGYGKDEEGKMSLNFGPLNKQGGERRLNVAITRARYHIKLFCSFHPSMVDVSKTSSQGVGNLIEYLKFAEETTSPRAIKRRAIDALDLKSSLVEAVGAEIEKLGYETEQNIGFSQNKIDLAIINPKSPQKYCVGIHFDSGAYANAPSARERERIRPNVFRSLGWRLYHLYTIDWVLQKEKVLQEIDKLVREIVEKPSITQIQAKIQKEIQETQIQAQLSSSHSPTPEEKTEKMIEMSNPNPEVHFEHHQFDYHPLSKKEKFSTEYREKLFELPGVKQYLSFEETNMKDHPIFYEDNTDVLHIAKEIIKKEGPIHFELLEDRLLAYYSFKRGSTKTSARITEIFSLLVDEGIDRREGFFYPANFARNLIRICLDPKDDPRNFAGISDLEIQNTLFILIGLAYSVEQKAIYSTCLDFFGIGSMNASHITRFDDIVENMVHEGMINRKDGILSKID